MDHSETRVRSDWRLEEVASIFQLALMELISRAAAIHRRFQNPSEVQVCTLLSVKTGGCPEDCAYCPQSVHYSTDVEVHPLLSLQEVIEKAQEALASGSTRFCMGAAWRDVPDNDDFESVLEMVKAVNDVGLEVCCTLGMLSKSQAGKLREAGLYAYNHNLDTGKSYYDSIITTRSYEERLQTLKHVRDAGLTVCCGGILGMGETDAHRIEMLHTLATLDKHPESVPINSLVRVAGTPLQEQAAVPIWEMVRTIATARILMPQSMVRLSAGRLEMSAEGQALCFLAGANSIFSGEKLLTTPNPEVDRDHALFEVLGLTPRPAFSNGSQRPVTE